MGVIHSIVCTISFCVERVLTWACCAFVLMLLMFTIILLMVYGISVGYHFAQKELAGFAMVSRTTSAPQKPAEQSRRAGQEPEMRPVVRLVAVTKSQEMEDDPSHFEVYEARRSGEKMYIESTVTPIIVLETERPPKKTDLSDYERELARRLIGRFRRSRANVTAASTPFFKPLRNDITNDTATALVPSV